MKNPGSATFLEFQRTNNIILVPVCFKDMGDHQFIPAGNFKVYIAVPTGIDYRSPCLRIQ